MNVVAYSNYKVETAPRYAKYFWKAQSYLVPAIAFSITVLSIIAFTFALSIFSFISTHLAVLIVFVIAIVSFVFLFILALKNPLKLTQTKIFASLDTHKIFDTKIDYRHKLYEDRLEKNSPENDVFTTGDFRKPHIFKPYRPVLKSSILRGLERQKAVDEVKAHFKGLLIEISHKKEKPTITQTLKGMLIDTPETSMLPAFKIVRWLTGISRAPGYICFEALLSLEHEILNDVINAKIFEEDSDLKEISRLFRYLKPINSEERNNSVINDPDPVAGIEGICHILNAMLYSFCVRNQADHKECLNILKRKFQSGLGDTELEETLNTENIIKLWLIHLPIEHRKCILRQIPDDYNLNTFSPYDLYPKNINEWKSISSIEYSENNQQRDKEYDEIVKSLISDLDKLKLSNSVLGIVSSVPNIIRGAWALKAKSDLLKRHPLLFLEAVIKSRDTVISLGGYALPRLAPAEDLLAIGMHIFSAIMKVYVLNEGELSHFCRRLKIDKDQFVQYFEKGLAPNLFYPELFGHILINEGDKK